MAARCGRQSDPGRGRQAAVRDLDAAHCRVRGLGKGAATLPGMKTATSGTRQGTEAARAPGRSLTLATWNMHYGIGRDNRFDMERVLAVIAETDADVIGLQEVGWHRPHHERLDHFAYLEEKSGYRVVECLVRDPLRSRFGNALLSRLPVATTRWIDLKVAGHAPRAALSVDLRLAEDHGLRVMVAHLGLIPWERNQQVQRLVAAADADLPPGWSCALVGDFNIWRRSTQSERLLRQRFPEAVTLPSFPAGRPMAALDRIFLSGGVGLEAAEVVERGAASLASDHLPVLARVTLPAPTAARAVPDRTQENPAQEETAT